MIMILTFHFIAQSDAHTTCSTKQLLAWLVVQNTALITACSWKANSHWLPYICVRHMWIWIFLLCIDMFVYPNNVASSVVCTVHGQVHYTHDMSSYTRLWLLGREIMIAVMIDWNTKWIHTLVSYPGTLGMEGKDASSPFNTHAAHTKLKATHTHTHTHTHTN